jgi:hypothetical protein
MFSYIKILKLPKAGVNCYYCMLFRKRLFHTISNSRVVTNASAQNVGLFYYNKVLVILRNI